MTKTWFSGIAVGFAACSLCAAQPAATALVTVDAAKELGPVKPMHTVNNGPSVKKPGGPVICGNFDWGRRFLGYCRDHDVPLDFFSWHVYATEPRQIADCAVRARKILDDAGFVKAERASRSPRHAATRLIPCAPIRKSRLICGRTAPASFACSPTRSPSWSGDCLS